MPMLQKIILCLLCLHVSVVLASTTSSPVTTSSSTNAVSISSNVTRVGNSYSTATYESTSYDNTDTSSDISITYSGATGTTELSTDSTVSFSFASLQTGSSTASTGSTQTMSSDSTESLSTGSAQHMSSDSTVSFSTGNTQTMSSDSTVSLSTGSTETMSSDSTVSLSTVSTQTMSSDSTVSFYTGSTETMSSDSTVSLSTGSTQTMSSDSSVSLSTGSTQTLSRESITSLSTGSTPTLTSDSKIRLSTGSSQTMSRESTTSLSTGSTPTLTSDSTTSLSTESSQTMSSDSTISLSTGSSQTMSSDSTVSLSTGSTQSMSSDSTISLSTGSTQTISSDSTVSLSTGSSQTMSSNSTISLNTGSTQTISSDSTVSLSTGSTQTMSSDSTVSLPTGSSRTMTTDPTSSLSSGSAFTVSSDSSASSSAGSTGAVLNRNVSTSADSTITFTTGIGVNNATTVTQTTSVLSNNGTTDSFTSSVPTSAVPSSTSPTAVTPTNSTITNTTSTTSTTTTTTTTTTTPPHGNGTTVSFAASTGGNTDISTTETTTSLPSPTTTVSLSGLLNNVTLTEVSFTYEGGTPVTQFRCQFDAMISPYKYRVSWTVNGVTTKTSTHDSSANTSTIVLKDYEISSFMLDSQIVCSVEVLSSDESTIVVSATNSSPLTPVQLETTMVSFQRGSSAQISILNNLYFGCHNDENCALEFLIYDMNDDYSCSDSTIAVQGETTCGKSGTIKTTSDVSGGTIVAVPENMTFTITTKNDYKYRLRSSFTLKVKVMVTGSSISRTSWNGEFSQTIAVTVTEPMNLTFTVCSLSSSGRINTFDRRGFKITDSEGEFVLYRHSTYDAEVQVLTKESSFSPIVHYVNGISVRAGQDVFTISHYGTDHVTDYKSVDSSSSNLLVRKKTSTYYSILFPYGTEVHVKRYPLANDAMHVVITPSASDVMNLNGLCGNMNDDDLDDYTKRDGSTASSDTDMANSWSVGSGSSYATENMFDTTNHASLNTWSHSHKLCLCPGSHTSSEKICGAQEDQTCSNGDISRSGSVVTRSTSSRRRRDADNTMESFADDVYLMGEFGDDMPSVMGEQIESHHIKKRSILYPNAIIACEAGLTSSCSIFSFDWINSTEERTRIIEWCAQDMMLDNTKDWVLYSCTDLQVLVLALLDKNNDFTESDPSTATTLIDDNCVGNCSNLGSCSNGRLTHSHTMKFQTGPNSSPMDGACTCDSGYGGPECTLNTGTAPTVHTTNNNGSVEISAGFTCLDMTTDGATDDAVCKIDVYEGLGSTADQTISFSLSYSLTVQAIVLSYNSIQCCLPSRRRRSTTTTNQQYGISTSNNGVIFSTSVYTTILDSTCQNITTVNNSTLIILLNGYCFINGQCYTDGSVNSASSCQYCTASYSVFNWNDTCVYPTKKDDDTLEPWAIALITLSCVGLVVMTAVIAYATFLKKKVTVLSRATRFRTGPSQRITQVSPGEEKYRGIWLRADADEEKAWA